MKKSPRCLLGRLFLTAGATLITAAQANASYQSTVQADNPIAYFALASLSAGGTGTDPDLSGNGNDAPYVNVYPITGPTAYLPNAGQFDPGSSSSVNLPSSAILNYSNTITMEAWVQPCARH